MDHRIRKANRKDISGVGFDAPSNKVQLLAGKYKAHPTGTSSAPTQQSKGGRVDCSHGSCLTCSLSLGIGKDLTPESAFSKGTLKDCKTAIPLRVSEFSWMTVTNDDDKDDEKKSDQDTRVTRQG